MTTCSPNRRGKISRDLRIERVAAVLSSPRSPRALHPVDAREPPAQALDGVAAFLRDGWVLPHLRHRRPAGALTGRARPPTDGPARVTDAGIHPPAVRGPAHRSPG